MSVDNLARAQWTLLSTAEPGTPAGIERTSQGEPTPQGQQLAKPHGVHLNAAVRLSKGWGPPLLGPVTPEGFSVALLESNFEGRVNAPYGAKAIMQGIGYLIKQFAQYTGAIPLSNDAVDYIQERIADINANRQNPIPVKVDTTRTPLTQDDIYGKIVVSGCQTCGGASIGREVGEDGTINSVWISLLDPVGLPYGTDEELGNAVTGVDFTRSPVVGPTMHVYEGSGLVLRNEPDKKNERFWEHVTQGNGGLYLLMPHNEVLRIQ